MGLPSRANPISLADTKNAFKHVSCRGKTADGGACKNKVGLNADGYCHKHMGQGPLQSSQPSKPTAADQPIGEQPTAVDTGKSSEITPQKQPEEDVQMGGTTPARGSPMMSFDMHAMQAMLESTIASKLASFAETHFQPLEVLLIDQMRQARKEATAAREEAAAATARAVAAEAKVAELEKECSRAFNEVKKAQDAFAQRVATLEAKFTNQEAVVVEKSLAKLKATSTWADLVRGGAPAATQGQQQRSTQPPVEQQFFMTGLEGVESKTQLEAASMVMETLGTIGVHVSELHDVVILKPRPGAVVGASRRVKFTVMTAMQARLIRASRKQLREVSAHISIRDVLSPEEQAAQNALWPQFIDARKTGKRAYFLRGQLFIDGRAVEAPASA